jgi:hypothetical protein
MQTLLRRHLTINFDSLGLQYVVSLPMRSHGYLSPYYVHSLARLLTSLPQRIIVTLALLIPVVTACISQHVRDVVDQRTALDSIGGLY